MTPRLGPPRPAPAPAEPRPPAADRGRRRLAASPATRRIWLLNGGIAGGAVLLAPVFAGVNPPISGIRVPWLLLALAFLAGELAVVHLRFRENAHSFSMSDVPLVVGLFFLPPLGVVTAQLAGNLVALVLHRRLPLIKVAFNLGQFALQSMVAALVFYTVLNGVADPLSWRGWLAALAGALGALLVADTLINVVITLSGGRVATTAMLNVLGLSSVAASMNVTLGLGAVALISENPRYFWIAAATPLFLFTAYLAYVRQREEGSRIQGILQATDALYRARHVDDAIVSATREAMSLLEAEIGLTVVTAEDGTGALVTAVGPDGEHYRMQQISVAPDFERIVSQSGTAMTASDLAELELDGLTGSDIRGAVGALLVIDDAVPVGYVVVCNRVGDVSSFSQRDVELLAALATQLSVSLQRGRLTESLAAATNENEQLNDLVQAKDQFVASVSHELRTPLTGVVGLARELNENFAAFESSEIQEVIAMIADQGTELANIIEDLLVAARADIGTLSIAPRKIELEEELTAVLQSHARSTGQVVEVKGVPPQVWADGLRLRQIIRNLLTNAARYGGDNVWIEIEERGAYCSILVVDDGPGVPPGKERAIFEAYESAHQPGTQTGSFGLGLSVARKIAEMSGGGLSYERRGTETVFRLRVPRRPRHSARYGDAWIEA